MRGSLARHRSPSIHTTPPLLGLGHRHTRLLATVGAAALASGFVVLTAPPASAVTPSNVFPAVAGGFQIDGNLASGVFDGTNQPNSVDWNSTSVAPQPFGVDPVGTADTTVLSGGSKEASSENWQMNTSAGATTKGDIANYYFWSDVYDLPNTATPHLFAYFGFERRDENGTVNYTIELNQKTTTHASQHGVTLPDRSPGDLLLAVTNHGSGGLTFSGTWSTWTCPTVHTCAWSDPQDIPSGSISGEVNSTAVPDPFTSAVTTGGQLDEEQFAEIGIDLSSLFPNGSFQLGCPSTPAFGQLSLRSRASESVTSELKDIVGPMPAHLRDLCADLRIEKTDGESHAVPGAAFLVSPNPLTGEGTLTVVDGGANDLTATGAQAPADGLIEFASAKPGTYTVTETAPPPGWIGDQTPKTKDVPANAVTTFTFENYLGVLGWQKVDADTGEHPGGATFVVHRTSGAGDQPDVTVTDNGARDLDYALGYLKVVGLKTGTYTVTETVAPTGYDLPGDAVQTATLNAETPTVFLSTPFRDPKHLSELAISLTKDGPALAHVGDTVTYTFAATNSGETDLVDATLVDPVLDDGTLTQTGFGNGDSVLSIGETWTWTGTHVVLADDPDPLPNTATVTGHDARGRTATDTADHLVDLIHPAISLVKTADNSTPSVGGTVTFSYVVTNTGDTTLYNVAVTDDVLGDIGTIPALVAGASSTLTASELVAANTPLTNVGTAAGTDVLKKQVAANDTETISVVAVNPPTPPRPPITNPPTPPRQPTTNPPLPTTGADVGHSAGWAFALLLTGALTLVVSRRPRATR